MIDFLLELDRDLFVAINGAHAEWLDPIMSLISGRAIWIPLYAFLLWLLWKDLGKKIWIYIIAIAMTITIADQVTTSIMKPFFERLRPSHDPALGDVIHIVDGRSSKFGFASSHAANTFALALFFFLVLGKRHRFIWLLFVWAIIVSYSRIYLGVHFPGDVIVGWIVGSLAALICIKLAQAADRRIAPVNDRH